MTGDVKPEIGVRARLSVRRWLVFVLALVVLAAPRQTEAGFLICFACICTLPDIFFQPALLNGENNDEVRTGNGDFGFGTSEPIPLGTPGQNSGHAILGSYQDWLVHSYFAGEDPKVPNISPTGGIGKALMQMTQEFTTVMMMQTQAVGGMMDAQDQLKTQLLLQRLVAQAHKDYQPDDELCMFGTAVRDLAAADFNGALTTDILSRHQQARELGEAGTKAANGPAEDRASRLAEFKDRYCDATDNDYVEGKPTTGLGLVCNTGPQAATTDRDIDYLRTVLLPRTLDIDFSDQAASGDETDVLALSSNLYASDLFAPLGQAIPKGGPNQEAYMNERAVVAKRSVAEESFDALIGMKTAGSADAATNAEPYLGAILQQLGLPAAASDPDIKTFLGARPSYLAQMEVLSKLIYMRPEFYSNLYDTPANVKRRSVAMQAIGVMIDRDIFSSYMRSEQLLSQLLEIRIGTAQQAVTSAATNTPSSR